MTMNTAAANDIIEQELAQRVSGGLEVTLFRNVRDSSTSIELRHAAIGGIRPAPGQAERGS